MSTVHTLYQLMRADFLERVRRYSFLITLGVVVYGTYLFVPPNHNAYATLQMGGHRGIYNSAWIGALTAMMGTTFMALLGFYLIKNAIRRDRITGVGEVIAATRVSKVSYTFGKFLSNCAVLAVMAGVLFVASGVMQLVRGEDYTIHFWAWISPYIFIALPIAVLTAGLGVLFESVSFLRRGLGNVIYYFMWTATLATDIQAQSRILGHGIIIPQMQQACAAAFPDYVAATGRVSSGFIFKDNGQLWDLTTFHWGGMDWTVNIILGRLAFVCLGALLAVAAGIFFDRFDTARPVAARAAEGGFTRTLFGRWLREARPAIATAAGSHAGLSPLTVEERAPRFRLWGIVQAEWRLMIFRHGMWWQVVALGLIIAGLLVPISVAREFLWPGALIWPILLWSSMGTRETRHRTGQFIFSSPRPLLRQLTAVWISGVGVTALVSSGMGLRLLLGGDMAGVLTWLVGVMFVPTMALAMGVWSGSGKLFEVTYLMLWYGGPMSRAPVIDYAGVIEGTSSSSIPLIFFAITAGLLVLAYVGRRWRLAQ